MKGVPDGSTEMEGVLGAVAVKPGAPTLFHVCALELMEVPKMTDTVIRQLNPIKVRTDFSDFLRQKGLFIMIDLGFNNRHTKQAKKLVKKMFIFNCVMFWDVSTLIFFRQNYFQVF